MHFPIIELKTERIKKDERLQDYELYEDDCVNYYTDYVGDEYTDAERMALIKGDGLAELLAGIAKVNPRMGAIKFYDADTIRDTIKEEVPKRLAELFKKKEEIGSYVSPREIAYCGSDWRGFEWLFHYEGCVHTSGGFISDAVWYSGKTMYIGAIIDCHC